MFMKQWCSGEAIFPNGFRSQVQLFSVLDPARTSNYISKVLDAGLHGPMFNVTLEENQEEFFMHYSTTQCWDMVLERLNQEITKQYNLRKQGLPTLQYSGSTMSLTKSKVISYNVVCFFLFFAFVFIVIVIWHSCQEACVCLYIHYLPQWRIICGLIVLFFFFIL